MAGWDNFLIAEVGASATLTGLIFVGVSINLTKIVSLPQLPSRALEALLLLGTVLLVSSLLLVPGQPRALVSLELLAVALGAWVTITLLDVRIWRKVAVPYRTRTLTLIVMNQVALLCYVAAAVAVGFTGGPGLYWLVPAVLLSFLKALLDAWVLLVEINR
jgi:hypothetical protein